VKLDPKFKVTVGQKMIGIPEPTYKLDVLLKARRAEVASQFDEHDEDDASVFQYGISQPDQAGSRRRPVVISDDEDDDPDDYDESWAHEDNAPMAGPSKARAVQPVAKAKGRPADDWKPDPDWVWQTVEHLLMPPSESTPGAIKSIQRELKAMLDEQKKATSLKELGWYMPPAIIENNDNLFQWIVGTSYDVDKRGRIGMFFLRTPFIRRDLAHRTGPQGEVRLCVRSPYSHIHVGPAEESIH
jgi:ubiquitin-conjugating enzyme E2 Q